MKKLSREQALEGENDCAKRKKSCKKSSKKASQTLEVKWEGLEKNFDKVVYQMLQWERQGTKLATIKVNLLLPVNAYQAPFYEIIPKIW